MSNSRTGIVSNTFHVGQDVLQVANDASNEGIAALRFHVKLFVVSMVSEGALFVIYHRVVPRITSYCYQSNVIR